jgi:hypothetical protein
MGWEHWRLLQMRNERTGNALRLALNTIHSPFPIPIIPH